MTDTHQLPPTKRKRLLKTLGPCPAGYTNDDLEWRYGLSGLLTREETGFPAADEAAATSKMKGEQGASA